MASGTTAIELNSFFTATLGILVLFLGKALNQRVRVLREFTIPEPVSGGLLVALLFAVLHGAFGLEVNFAMRARDLLLVYFFTSVGMNASFADLRRGGRPLLVLLVLTIVVMLGQNLLGVAMARWSGLPPAMGLLVGSVSLVGGHGTAVAWAPQFAGPHGVDNALEIGIAAATFGLVLASASGGPIARFLIRRHRLVPRCSPPQALQGSPEEPLTTPRRDGEQLSADDLLATVLALNVCILVGSVLQERVKELGVFLPLFVPCLLVGLLISNLLPRRGGRLPLRWPSRSPALDVVAEISLGTFLAMSLMTIQFWTLVDLAGPLLLILAAQFVFVLLVSVLLLFPLLGASYDAAVMAAGFSGYTLGSTATAMATMTAVTHRFGPSPRSFLVVPLVGAFFIDLLNAVMIPYFLRWG
jgi:ESS family glutamate:Na+ symporter